MKLKEWRWLNGYSQDQLADALGVKQPVVSYVETGSMQATEGLKRKFKEKFGKVVNEIEEFNVKEEVAT